MPPIKNLQQRKGQIRGALISRAAQWRSEGHSAVAGLVDDLVHRINEAETYDELEAAIRWFHAEVEQNR